MEEQTSSIQEQPSGEVVSAVSKSKGKPKVFACPSCGGSIKISAVGVTINAVCSQCSSLIDVQNDNYKIISKSTANTRKTLIEIGTRGTLKGILWEVIGYMERANSTEEYSWDEYLLYNPYYGFRFLMCDSGHWSFIKVLWQDIPITDKQKIVNFNNQKYRIFVRDKAIVKYVKGEFYWRVKVGEQVDVADYIDPPNSISVEKSKDELIVSTGEYVDAAEIAKAFNITDMPKPVTVGMLQPNSFGSYAKGLKTQTLLFVLLAVLIQFLTYISANQEAIYIGELSVLPTQKEQIFVGNQFALSESTNILITSEAAVNNNWVEVDVALVNEQNVEVISAVQPIEYYFGQDEDGSWSEGGQVQENYLPVIPAGLYRAVFQVDAGAFANNEPVTVKTTITKDIVETSNFYLALIFMLFYPIIIIFKNSSFESQRWELSDYLPNGSMREDGGDDSDD